MSIQNACLFFGIPNACCSPHDDACGIQRSVQRYYTLRLRKLCFSALDHQYLLHTTVPSDGIVATTSIQDLQNQIACNGENVLSSAVGSIYQTLAKVQMPTKLSPFRLLDLVLSSASDLLVTLCHALVNCMRACWLRSIHTTRLTRPMHARGPSQTLLQV